MSIYKFWNNCKSDSEQLAYCIDDEQAEQFAIYLDSCDVCSAINADDFTRFKELENVTNEQCDEARDADEILKQLEKKEGITFDINNINVNFHDRKC